MIKIKENNLTDNTDFDEDVNHPAHYNLNEYGIECIDAIQAAMPFSGFEDYLRGNIFKYLWRCNYKGTKLKDLHKAKWYLAKLIHIQEEEDNKSLSSNQMSMYDVLDNAIAKNNAKTAGSA